MKFEVRQTDGRARRGRMIFGRGVVDTPAFMPVGTYGTVKALTPEEVCTRSLRGMAACMISCTGRGRF